MVHCGGGEQERIVWGTGMHSILISHAWSEHEQYQSFVGLLDDLLGKENWQNLSIPYDNALDLSGTGPITDELSRTRAEITKLRAQLAVLPDFLERVVWDANGNRRKIEGRGSVLKKLKEALANEEELAERLAKRLPNEHPLQDRLALMNKGFLAKLIDLHPTLALALRHRIESARVVFVLITPLCMFRTWIDYETATASDLHIPVIAVMAGGTQTNDLTFKCSKVIQWERDAIRAVLCSQ